MSNKKQAIVNALKEAGYNSRMVSVKDGGGSLNWSFDLTIRDASVSKTKVEQIAKAATQYDVCEASGEILSGGNVFVHVRVSEAVKAIWSAEFSPLVDKAMSEVKPNSNGVEINDRFTLYLYGYDIRIHDNAKSQFLPMNYRSAHSIAIDLYNVTNA